LSEFTKGIRDFRIDVPETDIKRLFDAFDLNKDGSIDYDEFLEAIRGPMNDFRIKLVDRAFDKLDKNKDGVLRLDDIKGVYNAK